MLYSESCLPEYFSTWGSAQLIDQKGSIYAISPTLQGLVTIDEWKDPACVLTMNPGMDPEETWLPTEGSEELEVRVR